MRTAFPLPSAGKMSDSEEETTERQLKIVLLGDARVGKTCLAGRYCNNDFTKQYIPTQGVDFLLKREVLQKSRQLTLHIWDVGGSSRKMLDKYIFNANIIVIVFDVTNEVSFINLANWVETIRIVCGGQGNPPLIVTIGNKCDMEHQRVIKAERQNKYAQELHIGSYVTSSRTGEGVSVTFQRIIADFLGVRLTRSQVEEFQRVVRAEISTHSDLPPLASSQLPAVPSSSSVCTIQ